MSSKIVNVPILTHRKLINKGKMPLQLALFGLCETITINDSPPGPEAVTKSHFLLEAPVLGDVAGL